MRSVGESGASAEIYEKEKTRPRIKCEKMENSYFIVYDFMVEELKLGGSTLLVYALVYSFNKAGGDCYGSLEYIAERVGASRTTVYRALKELVRKEYLIKSRADRLGKISYRINPKLKLQNESPSVPECNTEDFDLTPNNKEIIKEITTTNNLSILQGKPEPSLYHFGREKVVAMTFHHYMNLLRAVGVTNTLRYVRILEGRILESSEGAYKNHYKTIITWAREDGLVDEEGEIILAN